ncbi:hypothetical protein VCHENC02_3646B, partial [Vibrio harveyi]
VYANDMRHIFIAKRCNKQKVP